MLSNYLQKSEIERLKKLLPDELYEHVLIEYLTEIRSNLIKTTKTNRDRFVIQLDRISWEQIESDCRNLLFWHEIARIQQHSFRSQNWATILLAAGLGMSCLEVFSQNVLLLATYLLLAGLAGWQLYQNNRGEGYIRKATQADRGAILLAEQFGYSLPKAYRSLHKALKTLSSNSSTSYLNKKEYQTRLQVLEMSLINPPNVTID